METVAMMFGESLFKTFCKVGKQEKKEIKMQEEKKTISPWPGLSKKNLASVEIHEAARRERKIGGDEGFRKAFLHMASMVVERGFTYDDMMPHIRPLLARSEAARWIEALLNGEKR